MNACMHAWLYIYAQHSTLIIFFGNILKTFNENTMLQHTCKLNCFIRSLKCLGAIFAALTKLNIGKKRELIYYIHVFNYCFLNIGSGSKTIDKIDFRIFAFVSAHLAKLIFSFFFPIQRHPHTQSMGHITHFNNYKPITNVYHFI